MSVTVKDIIAKMEQWCPASLACSWDNCGLQVGSVKQRVDCVLVALDVSQDIIEEAIAVQANLIVTHHPLIFSPLRNLCLGVYPQDVVIRLLEAGIAHLAAHTNLDMTIGGVNDTLAAILGLKEIRPLVAEGDMDGLGRIGNLPQPLTFSQLETLVKERLELDYLKVVPVEKEIRSVAVCGGSGMDLLVAAKEAGADCLISAEGKHHQALMAQQLDMGLIDAGHFDTEKIIVPVVAAYLKKCFPALTVLCSQTEKNYWLIR